MQNAAVRPARISLPDFSGRLFALSDDPKSWEKHPGFDGADVLLLGMGPGSPLQLPFVADAVNSGRSIYWLDSPKMRHMLRQAQGEPADAMPYCREISPGELAMLASRCAVWHYRPGLRVDPEFWGEVLGRLDAMPFMKNALQDNLCSRPCLSGLAAMEDADRKLVWLPGNRQQLLHQELAHAFFALGMQTLENEDFSPEHMPPSRLPGFALSVNFRGLDSEGRTFELLRALGIPLAIWLVDNPWHLLSGIRLPWWKKAALFLTDSSFISPLKEYGAGCVWHLPLAASWHMFNAKAAASPGPPVFIGRSAFPDQKGFFAGLKLSPQLLGEARSMIAAEKDRKLPDYHWWAKKISPCFWPGKAVRTPGYGADQCSALRKCAWLESGLHCGLQIVGDKGWEKLLPHCAVREPVDYYGPLPDIYASALCTLNVTSLLLPHSLNQRHFDVWAAGGFLLSDNTPGLHIFPPDLVSCMRLDTSADLPARLKYLASDMAARKDIIGQWREHIVEFHLYEHRIMKIRELLDSTI